MSISTTLSPADVLGGTRRAGLTGSSRSLAGAARRLGVGPAQLRASASDGKHPLDASLLGVASALPCGDLFDERRLVWDPTIEALVDHHADFDLDHVEPAGVLGGEVELEAVEDPACFRGFKRLVQGG